MPEVFQNREKNVTLSGKISLILGENRTALRRNIEHVGFASQNIVCNILLRRKSFGASDRGCGAPQRMTGPIEDTTGVFCP